MYLWKFESLKTPSSFRLRNSCLSPSKSIEQVRNTRQPSGCGRKIGRQFKLTAKSPDNPVSFTARYVFRRFSSWKGAAGRPSMVSVVQEGRPVPVPRSPSLIRSDYVAKCCGFKWSRPWTVAKEITRTPDSPRPLCGDAMPARPAAWEVLDLSTFATMTLSSETEKLYCEVSL